MGTAYTQGIETDDEAGIIPRAVRDIFEGVSEKKNADFLVKVSFIEVSTVFTYTFNYIFYLNVSRNLVVVC